MLRTIVLSRNHICKGPCFYDAVDQYKS